MRYNPQLPPHFVSPMEIPHLVSSPKLLVILEPHQEIARLLGVARRKAKQQRAAWGVVVIETPAMSRRFPKAECEAIAYAAITAEKMGAHIIRLKADNMLEGIRTLLADPDTDHASLIVADIKKKKHWSWNRPLISKLQATLGSEHPVISVPMGVEPVNSKRWTGFWQVGCDEILTSLCAVFVATLAIELINFLVPEAIGLHNRSEAIIYTIACAFAAERYGLLAGIIASVASFLTLNLLYYAPYGLMLTDAANAVNLGLFLAAALILSILGSRHYGHRLALTKRADRLHSLLNVHRLTLNQNRIEDAIHVLNGEISRLLETKIVIFLPSVMDENKLEDLSVEPVELSESDKTALRICWEESKSTGAATGYAVAGGSWHFEPLITSSDEIGVLAICITEHMDLDMNFDRLLSGIADQIALILERLQLGQMAEATRIQAEREKLRAMLLSSVSHDLKTPLASVIGSLSVYRSMGADLSEEHRTILIHTALEEAQRLDNFITNILDITRIESGQVELKEEWVRPNEWLREVGKNLRGRLVRNELEIVSGNKEKLEVCMDPLMTGQVLQNVLDNAAKYTPPGTKIKVSWANDAGRFSLSVRDYGNGIPEDQLEKIFDKYARLNKQDSKIAGTGLGLAIAKAVMLAQGGDIQAANHLEGGAEFTILLPKIRPASEGQVA